MPGLCLLVVSLALACRSGEICGADPPIRSRPPALGPKPLPPSSLGSPGVRGGLWVARGFPRCYDEFAGCLLAASCAERRGFVSFGECARLLNGERAAHRATLGNVTGAHHRPEKGRRILWPASTLAPTPTGAQRTAVLVKGAPV